MRGSSIAMSWGTEIGQHGMLMLTPSSWAHMGAPPWGGEEAPLRRRRLLTAFVSQPHGAGPCFDSFPRLSNAH